MIAIQPTASPSAPALRMPAPIPTIVLSPAADLHHGGAGLASVAAPHALNRQGPRRPPILILPNLERAAANALLGEKPDFSPTSPNVVVTPTSAWMDSPISPASSALERSILLSGDPVRPRFPPVLDDRSGNATPRSDNPVASRASAGSGLLTPAIRHPVDDTVSRGSLAVSGSAVKGLAQPTFSPVNDISRRSSSPQPEGGAVQVPMAYTFDPIVETPSRASAGRTPSPDRGASRRARLDVGVADSISVRTSSRQPGVEAATMAPSTRYAFGLVVEQASRAASAAPSTGREVRSPTPDLRAFAHATSSSQAQVPPREFEKLERYRQAPEESPLTLAVRAASLGLVRTEVPPEIMKIRLDVEERTRETGGVPNRTVPAAPSHAASRASRLSEHESPFATAPFSWRPYRNDRLRSDHPEYSPSVVPANARLLSTEYYAPPVGSLKRVNPLSPKDKDVIAGRLPDVVLKMPMPGHIDRWDATDKAQSLAEKRANEAANSLPPRKPLQLTPHEKETIANKLTKYRQDLIDFFPQRPAV